MIPLPAIRMKTAARTGRRAWTTADNGGPPGALAHRFQARL
jgi:hypothetical protein